MGISDFGSVGQTESTPTLFHWNILWNIGWLLIYPVLALFFLFKPNRNQHAVKLTFLFIPLLGIQLLAGIAFPAFVEPLTYLLVVWASFAVLWLLGFSYVGGNRAGVFLRAVIMLSVVTFLAALTINGLDPETIIPSLLVNLSLFGLFVFAAFCCRRRFTPLRFLLYSFLSSILCAFLLAVCFALVSPFPSELKLVMIPVIMGISILVVMVALVPFLGFAFFNPCFRQRFDGILRLQSAVPVNPVQPMTDEPPPFIEPPKTEKE